MCGLKASTSTNTTNAITQPDSGAGYALPFEHEAHQHPQHDRDDQHVAGRRQVPAGDLELDGAVEHPQVDRQDGTETS